MSSYTDSLVFENDALKDENKRLAGKLKDLSLDVMGLKEYSEKLEKENEQLKKALEVK